MEIDKEVVREVLFQLNNANEQLNRVYPKEKWDDEFKEKIKIEFTYQSNRIEGNTFTYNDTLRFLKEAAVIKNKNVKDTLDIKNHFEVLDDLFEGFEKRITVESILSLHRKLMKDPDQWDFYSYFSPGRFKVFANYTVRVSGKIYEYMQPELVENAIRELVGETNKMLQKSDFNQIGFHPIGIASYFHNKFVYIHPFEDGNGRIARIFTNQLLMQSDFPPLILKQEAKERYFEAIIDAHDNGNLLPTIHYFAETLLNQIKTILDI